MEATRTFFYFFPLLIPFVKSFEKSLYKAHATRLRLKFLKRCLDEQVIPKSLLPARLRNFSDHPFNDFCALSLREHIKNAKQQDFQAFKEFRKCKSEFFRNIPIDWIDRLLDRIYWRFRFKINSLQLKLDNKLQRLINNSVWTSEGLKNCDKNCVNLLSKIDMKN